MGSAAIGSTLSHVTFDNKMTDDSGACYPIGTPPWVVDRNLLMNSLTWLCASRQEVALCS